MGTIHQDAARRQRYENHLRSDYWQRVRQTKYDEQNGLCSYCHKHLGNKYDCHHRDYSVFGHELDALQTVTCVHRECHEEIHRPKLTWAELAARFAKL